MTDPDVILTSSNHPTAAWPHAIIDCLSTPPCTNCYCYICDVPISQCDDRLEHAPADGRRDAWNTIKRRRRALFDTWTDIPTFVNLIVSLSVEEAIRRIDAKSSNAQPHDVEMHLIADAFEQVVNIKSDTSSITPTTTQVEQVQVDTTHTPKKEPY